MHRSRNGILSLKEIIVNRLSGDFFFLLDSNLSSDAKVLNGNKTICSFESSENNHKLENIAILSF